MSIRWSDGPCTDCIVTPERADRGVYSFVLDSCARHQKMTGSMVVDFSEFMTPLETCQCGADPMVWFNLDDPYQAPPNAEYKGPLAPKFFRERGEGMRWFVVHGSWCNITDPAEYPLDDYRGMVNGHHFVEKKNITWQPYLDLIDDEEEEDG